MTLFLSTALLIAVATTTVAPEPDPPIKAIAPLVGEEVLVVAHIDLAKINVEALAQHFLAPLSDAEEAADLSKAASSWIASLRTAGAKELFLVVDPADLPGPPLAVIPLSQSADAKAISKLLCGGAKEKPLHTWPASQTLHGALVAGPPAAIERIRQQKTHPRPELFAALSRAGQATAAIVVLPSPNQRRVLEEMVPLLPQELGAGPTTIVTKGLTWALITLDADPKTKIRLLLQAKDPAAATSLAHLAELSLPLIGKTVGQQPPPAELVKEFVNLKPQVVNDQVELLIDLEQASTFLASVSHSSLESTRRVACFNNLKQLGLAFHNYHNTHNTFPPAFTTDKQGKPLLSWRVAILPFIEQQALYKEFKLDEPWDSPHNKALIERMPPTYKCPSESRKTARAGKTTYLVPRGKSTIFPGAQPIKLSDITDGTSNTLLVIDADDDQAVVWTKPDDWSVDPELKKEGLFSHHPGGFNTLFADGSARFIKRTITLEVLRHLMTRNGGEVIKYEDF